MTRKERFLFYMSIAGFYVIAWLLQARLFVNCDVNWLINATQRMIAGGTYTQDFFSANPPMISYLYMVPVIISKAFALNIISVFRIYIFLLATISLFVCSIFVKYIFFKRDMLLAWSFLSVLTAVFLILPLYLLGQREHLLLMLAMPYFLAVTYRLQDKPLKVRYAIAIGLLAGLGFSIKPQFLIMPLLIEIYYICCKKNVLAWLRAETLTIFAVLITYVITIFVFFRDFIFIVLPYVIHNYYSSIGYPWLSLALNPLAVFSGIVIVFYFMQYKENPYKILSSVLLVALIGSLLSYFSQHTLFLYHILPAFSLAILLSFLQFGVLVSRVQRSKSRYIWMGLFCVVMLAFFYHFVRAVWVALIFSPGVFFVFFACLFAILLYIAQKNKNLTRVFVSVTLIISISFWFSYMAQHTSWYAHRFLMTIILLITLFGLLVAKDSKSIGEHIVVAVFGMLLFSYPVLITYEVYHQQIVYKQEELNKLIAFMQTQGPNQSIYAFSILGNIVSPLNVYTGAVLAGRFDCLWMVAQLIKQREIEGDTALRQYIKNNMSKRFFLNMIIDDLHNNKPSLVFVDAGDPNALLAGHAKYFNFLSYFSENENFKTEWKFYRYLTTLSHQGPFFPNYKLQVYKRINSIGE